jgi:hypothetical protein
VPQVLPNQTIDGQDIQVKPTNPSRQYLDWWENTSRAAAAGTASAEGAEDGEAAVDEDSAEMEATEAVMDLVAQRMGSSGGAGGANRSAQRSGGGNSRRDRSGASAYAPGSDTDALISGVAQEANRCVVNVIYSLD